MHARALVWTHVYVCVCNRNQRNIIFFSHGPSELT